LTGPTDVLLSSHASLKQEVCVTREASLSVEAARNGVAVSIALDNPKGRV